MDQNTKSTTTQPIQSHQLQKPTQSIHNKQQPQSQNTQHQQQSLLSSHSQKLQEKHKNLVQQISSIKNQQVQLQVQQQLTQSKKQQNQQSIKNIVKQVLILQQQLQIIKQIKQKQYKIQTQQQYQHIITKQLQKYTISQQILTNRYTQLIQQPNDSNWTDATQSQADDDQIWAVDDQIIKAMEQDSQQQIDQQQQQDGDNKKNKKQQIDINQLQQQFITGQQSDHQVLFGTHDKFCVSVNGIGADNLLFSGGGDDYLYMYKLPKDNIQIDKDKCLSPYHIVKHTQTINKIQVSYSKQYIMTMTDNQILCTQIKTQKTTTLKTKDKKQQNKKQMKKQQDQDQEQQSICSDMVCHHLGDVVAVANGYQLEIFNIKGLTLYQTYYCQRMIDSMVFTQSGKQLALACDDNRIRLLTPKTSQIVTVAGVKQHQTQITALKTKGDIVLTGDLDGYIGVTTLKKSTLTTLIGSKQTQDVEGSINQLQFAGNYFIAGSSFDYIDWYDLGKCKKFIQSNIQGSCSDICWQGKKYQHLYNVSTIKGNIYLFDCRNPLKQIAKTRAGNTIHKLWADSYILAAACQDGNVRLFDIRKYINNDI